MTKKSEFKDLVIINNTSFKDKRGYFKELLREKKLKKRFPFLVMSFSKKNVIRGLHLQKQIAWLTPIFECHDALLSKGPIRRVRY